MAAHSEPRPVDVVEHEHDPAPLVGELLHQPDHLEPAHPVRRQPRDAGQIDQRGAHRAKAVFRVYAPTRPARKCLMMSGRCDFQSHARLRQRPARGPVAPVGREVKVVCHFPDLNRCFVNLEVYDS
jgi:hypothetical protein